MILDILINQYSETEEEIKAMLDSIAMQRGIDFNNVRITIGNDGADIILSEELLTSYNFDIDYKIFEHSGVAGTRKNLFHSTSGDYLMFCDGDDCFASTIALNTYFNLMEKGYNMIIPDFIEEVPIFNQNKIIYYPYHKDPIRVHGKVYKRQALIDNEIEWDPKAEFNEDSAFNILAITVLENVCYYNAPLYIWKYRKNSVARNPLYTLNTWDKMIDSYDSCIYNLIIRGYGDQARYYSYFAIWTSYYTMMSDYWHKNTTDERDQEIYDRLKEFIEKYRLLIKKCPQKMKEIAEKQSKKTVLKKFILEPTMSFEEWFSAYLES